MTMSMYSLEENVFVSTVISSCNVLVHILMGMIVGVALLFAVKMEFNETAVPENIIMLHILLCVPGYTLLMSQALLSMTSYNTWSSKLSETNRQRTHGIIQTVASGLAVTGCIIIMMYKDVNFDTLHGQFGMVALVFTFVSILAGVASLFSENFRRFIPPVVSKVVHIILGIVTYSSAAACLCFAFNKTMFRDWTSDNVVIGVIFITTIFTCIIMINPCFTLCKKCFKVVKRGIEK